MSKLDPGFALCALLLLVSSCGKEAPDVDPNYVGYWLCTSLECEPGMRIKPNGDATYDHTHALTDCNGMNHSGTARISDGHLRIGSKRLEITQAPTAAPLTMVHMERNGEHASTMQLVLSGATYYRLDNY